MKDKCNSVTNKELKAQYSAFRAWYLRINDADESLVSEKYLSNSFDLSSPSHTVNCLWSGWKAAKGF